MNSERISLHILEACKKEGIEYCSINHRYLQLVQDARRLGEIYLQLKIIAGGLQEISERYAIKMLSGMLTDDISEIEKIDHDIIKVMNKMREEIKNE